MKKKKKHFSKTRHFEQYIVSAYVCSLIAESMQTAPRTITPKQSSQQDPRAEQEV